MFVAFFFFFVSVLCAPVILLRVYLCAQVYVEAVFRKVCDSSPLIMMGTLGPLTVAGFLPLLCTLGLKRQV